MDVEFREKTIDKVFNFADLKKRSIEEVRQLEELVLLILQGKKSH